MKTSIVMTTFNRPRQLLNTLTSISKQFPDADIHPAPEIIVVDDGNDDRTPGICDAFDCRWIRLHRGQSAHYRNQAHPLNVGIRVAKGEIILLQNAECKHASPNVVKNLVDRVDDRKVIFARVIQINQDGTQGTVYCGPENPRPYFFCGAILREHFLKLRGFDEDYQGYGYEDDDMADRLTRSGVEFVFTDIEVHHQWHEPAGLIDASMQSGRDMFEWKRSTDVVRNLGREWGAL